MAGGGSISGMIISLRNNGNLLRKRSMFRTQGTFLNRKNEYFRAANGEADFKKTSPNDLIKVRNIIALHKKKETRSFIMALFIASMLLLAMLSFGADVWKSGVFNPSPIYSEKDSFNNSLEKKQAAYLFFIEDGDNYIVEQHWNNAIFQYWRAIELFPTEFDARYRLVIAYGYKCQNTGKDCAAGKKLWEELLVGNPDKIALSALGPIFRYDDSKNN